MSAINKTTQSEQVKIFLKSRRIANRLKQRHRYISPSDEKLLSESLAQHYFLTPSNYLNTVEGKLDLNNHLSLRTESDRRTIVPWLDSLFTLDGANIIEIGCGTCSSTVALAEQGAFITACDVDLPSLAVGRDRLAIYGLNADLKHNNASELQVAEISKADAVIFFASVEHMTLDEKLDSFSMVWRGLPSGAYLVIVETPNRLWWFDGHTAMLPFYLWLPDDLAAHYSKHSPRWPFNEQLRPPVTSENLLRLTRIGRSASYHELELAIGDLSQLSVRSLNRWKRVNAFQYLHWFVKERFFEKLLRRLGPPIHAAFYERQLQLAIRKP